MNIKDKLFGKLKDIQKEYRVRDNAKKQQTRVSDLYVKTHRVGGVELPIMSALAWDTLEKVFGEKMEMDLECSRDVGCVVYILEHQADAKPVINNSKEELLRLGAVRSGSINYIDMIDYMFCIDEQFLLIKKKSLEDLEKKQEKLKKDLEAIGE